MKNFDYELQQERIAEKELLDCLIYDNFFEGLQLLEKLRKKKNIKMTQREFAENIGISYTSYKTYLNGQRNCMRLKHFINAVNILNLNDDDFQELIIILFDRRPEFRP